MAHRDEDPCGSYIKLETEGEGNYASTRFLETRDPQTDQGLTPLPKIQSSDQWQFDAACSLSNEDLEALLGPVQTEFLGEDVRVDDSWVHELLREEERQLYEASIPTGESANEPSEAPIASQHPTNGHIEGSTEQAIKVVGHESRSVSLNDQAPRQQLPPTPIPSRSLIDSGYGPSIGDSGWRESAVEPPPFSRNESGPNLKCHNEGSGESQVRGDLLRSDSFIQHSQTPRPASIAPRQHSRNHTRLSLSRLDPDVPIASIEKASQTMRTETKLPYWMTGKRNPKKMSKKKAVELGLKMGLFGSGGHEKRPQNEAATSRNLDIPLNPNSNLNTPPQISNSSRHNVHDTSMASDTNLHDMLALATTMVMSPPDRSSSLLYLSHIKTLMSTWVPELSPGASPTQAQLPPEQREQWDAIFAALGNNESWRQCSFYWIIEKIGKILQEVQEDAQFYVENKMPAANQDLDSLDLAAAKAIIRSERMVNNNLMEIVSRLQKFTSSQKPDTKDAQIQSLKARLQQMTNERDMYRVFAQSLPAQPSQAVESVSSTKSNMPPPTRPTSSLNCDEGLENHPRWQCMLTDWTNHGQCLGINFQFYSRGSKWVTRVHCFKCQRPNKEARMWMEPPIAGYPNTKPNRQRQTVTPTSTSPKGARSQSPSANTNDTPPVHYQTPYQPLQQSCPAQSQAFQPTPIEKCNQQIAHQTGARVGQIQERTATVSLLTPPATAENTTNPVTLNGNNPQTPGPRRVEANNPLTIREVNKSPAEQISPTITISPTNESSASQSSEFSQPFAKKRRPSPPQPASDNSNKHFGATVKRLLPRTATLGALTLPSFDQAPAITPNPPVVQANSPTPPPTVTGLLGLVAPEPKEKVTTKKRKRYNQSGPTEITTSTANTLHAQLRLPQKSWMPSRDTPKLPRHSSSETITIEDSDEEEGDLEATLLRLFEEMEEEELQ